MEPNFYSRYPGFQPNPSAPAVDEFARLARHMRWKHGSKAYKRGWASFGVSEFSKHYGTEASKLQNWQSLCREVGLSEPKTITQCKKVYRVFSQLLRLMLKISKALAKVHVNIIDLIDARRTGAPVTIFRRVQELRQYTQKTQKIFPKEVAKQDGFLKALLRGIF
ncbi:hypothetical protein MGYG_07893 [Nannizzia gypsea CBS 118893]|uniref:Uncharacterized protein n=1 Tax=Arthroderma gypseum (strain ATCC MYA-4604 / CBS 118893) TaxID=535722 RepID=E4V4G7_ARTGP|nr:hypothetical protein MGYG_07893 [Nannizzia gypsea CBS 118893]EFR04891.1 hypothetical protein MGYG_07893 [Nannizzia gypsea CBS 118893]